MDAGTGIDADLQLASLGQAVITTDPDGVVVYWNRAAEELYGWTAEEAVGRDITTLSVPDLAQEVAADITRALREGVAWSGGFPVRRKDGTVFPALVTDSGIYRDGVLVGIVGVSTNLGTALRPLLERSTDAALVLRSDAVITYASAAVEQLFGWEQDALVGGSIVPLLHEDDRPTLARLLEDVGARPGAHPAVEIRVRAYHDWRWAEAALTNLLDDPVVQGVVCNLRTNPARTAHQQAESRIAQLETALESRLTIELAKGYLGGRHDLAPEDAYQLLRGYARSHHLTLRDVCLRVVAGDLALTP